MLFWFFFNILVFELACHLERFVLEYDYCVSGKISPKRHFGIEHAVLGLFFVWDDSCVLAKIIPKQGTLEYEHVNWELVLVSDDPCVAVKKTPKRQFGIEHAVLFFLYISFWAGSHLERFIVEYDYCVSGKISPKRHFGIEHAVLGLFFVWDDFSSVLAKIIPKEALWSMNMLIGS